MEELSSQERARCQRLSRELCEKLISIDPENQTDVVNLLDFIYSNLTHGRTDELLLFTVLQRFVQSGEIPMEAKFFFLCLINTIFETDKTQRFLKAFAETPDIYEDMIETFEIVFVSSSEALMSLGTALSFWIVDEYRKAVPSAFVEFIESTISTCKCEKDTGLAAKRLPRSEAISLATCKHCKAQVQKDSLAAHELEHDRRAARESVGGTYCRSWNMSLYNWERAYYPELSRDEYIRCRLE